VALQVPALSDRKEDIPLLAQHFLQMFAAKN
jgi:DNA-binding NtrC family response regulator